MRPANMDLMFCGVIFLAKSVSRFLTNSTITGRARLADDFQRSQGKASFDQLLL